MSISCSEYVTYFYELENEVYRFSSYKDGKEQPYKELGKNFENEITPFNTALQEELKLKTRKKAQEISEY